LPKLAFTNFSNTIQVVSASISAASIMWTFSISLPVNFSRQFNLPEVRLPNAALRGLALTPDNSHLVVADFGAQSIYLIDPDTSSGSASFVGGIPGYVNSGPSRVAATSAQTVSSA